jgi:hypothetical protein
MLQNKHNTRKSNDFILVDAELANRLTRAFNHAIELRNGGGKEPF